MDLVHAKTSALAQSLSLGLEIINDISDLQSQNYGLQKNLLSIENQSAKLGADMTEAAGEQDASDMMQQAYGEYSNAGFQLGGVAFSGGYELYENKGVNGIKDYSQQYDSLTENEAMIERIQAEPLNPQAVQANAVDPASEAATRAAVTRAKNASVKVKDGLSEADLRAAKNSDPDAFDEIKAKVERQKKEVGRAKERLEKKVSDRQQMAYQFSQGAGGVVGATFKTKSAAAKSAAAEDRALQQIAQYSSGAAQGSFQATSQGNSALASARDAEYQNLQLIARSNQPA